jgi:hypothetical protein
VIRKQFFKGPIVNAPQTANHELVLTEGGPTYRIEKRLGTVRENAPRIVRRALLSICLTWLVLLALAAFQGFAIGHRVEVPFLRDFAVHARFLLAVPILLLAETIVGPRVAEAARHFVSSGVVVEEDYGKFETAVARGLAWRDSTAAEVIFVVVSYAVTAVNLRWTAVHVSTWSVLHNGSGASLTWAGWWLVFFCIPLFQFLSLRWLWRLFLWGQFLWRMTNLKLHLAPTHPDGAAGLGFVGEAQRFFAVILIAYSVVVAGVLANSVLYDHIPLVHFASAIAAYVVAAVLFILIPLCVFAPVLFETKISGMAKYGSLASEYTQSFQQKWIVDRCNQQEILLGTADIQSLADLGNSFAFVEKMKVFPMASRTPIHLAIACLIPMAPLLLTVMPLKDILEFLFKAVF